MESSCSWSCDNVQHCYYKTFLSSTPNRLDGVFERREEVFSFECQPRFDALSCAVVTASGDTSPDQVHAVASEEAVVQSDCDIRLRLPSHGNILLRGARQMPAARLRKQFQFATEQEAQQEQQQTAPAVARPIISAFSSADKLSYYRDPIVTPTSELIQAVDDEDLKGVGESHSYVLSRRTGCDAGALPKLQSSGGNRMQNVQTTGSKLYVKASYVPPVESMEESSRSSSFRSQSTCESGERETGESSTSWHSNGSSRDASVNIKEQQTTTSDQESRKRNGANSESAAGHLNTGAEALSTLRHESSPDPNSWLRFPFDKLKGLFGSKKTLKPSVRHIENLTQEEQVPRPIRSFELSHGTDATTNPYLRAVRLSCSEQNAEAPALKTPCRHSYTETPSSSCKGSTFASGTCSTPGMQRSNAKEPSTTELDRRATATGYAVYSKCLLPAFDDTLVSDGRGTIQGNLSKMRERWLQYMKILKLPYGRKTSPGKPPELHTAAGTRPSPKIRLKTSNFPAPQDAAPSSASADESGRPKSMLAIETTPVRPKSTSGAPGGLTISRIGSRIPDHSSIMSYGAGSRHSFPSAVERAGFLSATSSPKFSNRLSMGLKVKSSPKVGSSSSTSSPRRSNNNSSSSNRSSAMSELHSSVQGAIAHCKKSHSAQLPQDCE